MSNTLILHIGTPKTGTTSIQNFLYINRDKLKEVGWLYPDFHTEWYNLGHFNKRDFKDQKSGSLMMDYDSWPRLRKSDSIKLISRWLREYNVILSNENFWHFHFLEMIRDIQKASNAKIKVICYLRRQDLFIESDWQNMVKQTNQIRNINEYFDLYDASGRLNYLLKIQKLMEYIPAENIIVRPFEKSVFAENDLIEDFRIICGIPSGEYEKGINKNEAIPNYVTEWKLLINRLYSENAGEKWFVPEETLEEIFKGVHGKKEPRNSYLSYDMRKKIIKKYEDGNKKIAEMFEINDGKALFIDPIETTEVYTSSVTEREIQLIEIMFKLMYKESDRKNSVMRHATNKVLNNQYCLALKRRIVSPWLWL